MKKLILLLTIVSLSSCSTQIPMAQVQPSPKVFLSKADSTQIIHKEIPVLGSTYTQLSFETRDAQAILSQTPRPTEPLTMAVLAGIKVADVDVCNLPFSAVTKAIFSECLQEGMNYFQVANTFGFEGEEKQRTGDEVTYSWGAGQGTAVVVFKNDKLYSKLQTSLK